MNLGGHMEAEMREQPALFAANCGGYFQQLKEALAGESFDMILLAARGSSDNAAIYARYLMEIHLQIPVSLAAPSVLTRYQAKVRYPKCLAVGISQSGAAPDVSEVLSYVSEQGHTTLAITNTAGSRLTQVAKHSLILDAGLERSIAATKTYSLTLLAMVQLVRALGGHLPDPKDTLLSESQFEILRSSAEQSVPDIVRNPLTFCLARGYSFCSALETALKLMECALLNAKPYSTADFEHGPKALATHNTACLIYGEVPPGLAERGSNIVSAPDIGGGPYAPINEIIFGQWMALLAARSRGLNPDMAPHLKKVTETL